MKKLLATMALLGILPAHAFAVSCSGLPEYKSGSYNTNDKVQSNAHAYTCLVGGWCTIGGPYAPGVGWAWQNAWSDQGACDAVTSSVSSLSSVMSSVKSSVPSSKSSSSSSVKSSSVSSIFSSIV